MLGKSPFNASILFTKAALAASFGGGTQAVGALTMSASSSAAVAGGDGEWSIRPLPPFSSSTLSSDRLVIGYSHDPSGSKVRRAVQSGVNVVCWSFLHLTVVPDSSPVEASSSSSSSSSSFRPDVRTDLNLNDIRTIRTDPNLGGLVHMAAIGGWNGPHPPPGIFDASTWAEAIWSFNARNGYVFDGIDWDLEGHDDRSAPTSKFDIRTLDLMADVSVLLKDRYKMIVSMAPAESYFDALAEDESFSLDLNLSPRPWVESSDQDDRRFVQEAGFEHAGRQCYAYVWHRAGGVRTFDWVSLQLYEAYSRYMHETSRALDSELEGQDAKVAAQVEGVRKRVVALFDGFVVDLPGYGRTRISVPPKRLVFGFANGWADDHKFVRVRPETLRTMLFRMKIAGIMFWTIEEEGNGGMYIADDIATAISATDEDDHHKHDDDDDDDDEVGEEGYGGGAQEEERNRDEL